MKILCIETSASLCSVAIVNDDTDHYCENVKPMGHAELLMDLIRECLKKANMEINELDAVALSGGPGSYTGLRIGCSSAKGICYALNIPLIAIDTLKIIAYATRQGNERFNYFWPMVDARRMEVYHAVYNKDLESVVPVNNGIINAGEFIPDIARFNETVLGGDGASKAAPILKMMDGNVVANALSMCDLSRQAYRNSEFVDTAYYEPFYLKQANITVSKT